MTLRHFTIFLAICDRGSMTAAAEALGMTQPPVSQSVAELERHYGVELFERVGKRLRITPAGESLRASARDILGLVDQAERGLFDLQDAGTLRVGASATIGAAILPAILANLRRERPRLRLSVAVDNTATVIDRLRAAELDVAYVEGGGEWSDLSVEALRDEELVLVCAPSHEFAERRRIRKAALAGRDFVVREEGSGTRESFSAAMDAAGLGWRAAGVAKGADAIVGLVAAGLGIAFVSRLLAGRAIEEGMVVPVEVEGLAVRRGFRLARRAAKRPTEAMLAFAEACRNEAAPFRRAAAERRGGRSRGPEGRAIR